MADFSTAILYPVVATAIYMLGSHDLITEAIWSRYPAAVDRFMSCPTCFGTWCGFALAGVGAWQGWSFFGLPSASWLTVVAVGLWCKTLVPIIAKWHIDGIVMVSGDDLNDSRRPSADD